MSTTSSGVHTAVEPTAGGGRPRLVGPCLIVIFGSLGDLAARKLLPAIYNLAARRLLPDAFRVVGVGRREMTSDEYRDKVAGDLSTFMPERPDGELWEWFRPRLEYAYESLADEASYSHLKGTLETLEGVSASNGGVVFYLATPPSAFADIVENLGRVGLLKEDDGRYRRIVVEKPFGYDLHSALTLNHELASVLDERQIYRIDHYLGKETVQNLLAFRFGNGIFEPIWNRRYIDHVQITVAETVGVEQRGAYYEAAGALRDMVQNHLFQLLALVAMEPPISFHADSVRDERVKVLRAIKPVDAASARSVLVRGQYGAGNANGKPVPAYRQEDHVSSQSTTETFIALKLLVENWRWAGVPFYLRTGKRLRERASEIAVEFKRAPLLLFRDTPVESLQPNVLTIHIQPDEGMALRFHAKIPGAEMRLGNVTMDFCYADYFDTPPQTGYETLLYDCMVGDQTLFHRADMIEAGWTVVDPILHMLENEPWALLHQYSSFSWGPAEADVLIERDGRAWHNPDPSARRCG